MSTGIVRSDGNRLANPLHGEVMPAYLMGDDAKEMQRFGMAGMRGQDLAVERLGIGQPPGLMVLECQREGL